MKRMLCVFAHPDDECYGPGGTIAQCALDGGEVFITMFTSGDAGTIGVSKTLSPHELAARRRAEFAASCDALGVTGHRMLDVPDGGVNRVGANWAVREIVEDIRKHRPQVVLTFHHLGVSSHPDHIAVAGFLDRAFAETDGPLAYFEWGIPEDRAPLYERPGLIPIPDHEIAARVDVGEAAMERKLQAIRAHVTQYDFFLSLQEKFDYRDMATPEHFGLRRARPPRPPRPGLILTDLWEGLDV